MSAGTLAVFVVTAAVALVQLKHLRVAYWLTAASTLLHVYWTPQFQDWLHDVALEFPGRIKDPAFREELRRGPIERKRHPELFICEYFSVVGAYVKNGYIPSSVVLDGPGHSTVQTWVLLWPAIKLIRESSDPTAFEDFEYLAVICQRWLRAHPQGAYPKRLPRFQHRPQSAT